MKSRLSKLPTVITYVNIKQVKLYDNGKKGFPIRSHWVDGRNNVNRLREDSRTKSAIQVIKMAGASGGRHRLCC